MSDAAFLRCIEPDCGGTRELTATDFSCPKCDGLLDVSYEWNKLNVPTSIDGILSDADFSGVWRFHQLLPFVPKSDIVSIGEGQTILQQADRVAAYVDLAPGSLFLQYEGLNPSGSFKDNGMTAAFSHARITGAARAACASTGNTSASLALYCAASGQMRGIVFVGSGKISFGKLAQALDHGALTLQIAGDFDDAMRQVQIVSRKLGIYLVNSINPFRLEGQKTIMYRVLEALHWRVPDWIVLPGGNLGNTAAFGKAFAELKMTGLLKELPRLAVINAAGADTFFQLFEKRGVRWSDGSPDLGMIESYYAELERSGCRATTIASAIEINRPVNLVKALRSLAVCGGVVRTVSDEEILDAKAQVGAGGFGCEPASAASVAGLKKLRAEGIIARSDRVVCILTGHALKDSDATRKYHGGTARFANAPIAVANDANSIIAAIEGRT